MKRIPTIINHKRDCDLPTNVEMEGMSVEERIQLGNKHMLQGKKDKILRMCLDRSFKKRINLSSKEKQEQYQKIYNEEKAKIHNKIFG